MRSNEREKPSLARNVAVHPVVCPRREQGCPGSKTCPRKTISARTCTHTIIRTVGGHTRANRRGKPARGLIRPLIAGSCLRSLALCFRGDPPPPPPSGQSRAGSETW
eukprot:3910637-Prymnesium_polylepis.2